MPFIRCSEDFTYASRLTTIVDKVASELSVSLLETSLDNVAFPRRYTGHYFLSNLWYWHKEAMLEHPLCMRAVNPSFICWHCVEFSNCPPFLRGGYCVHVPASWAEYEGSSLLFASTPAVFAYYSGRYLNRLSADFIFRAAVTEHSVYCLSSFLLSAFERGSIRLHSTCSGAEDEARCGVFRLLPVGVRHFVDHVGIFEVTRQMSLVKTHAWLAYHRTVEVDWGHVGKTSWLPYGGPSGEVRSVPGPGAPSGKRGLKG